MIVTLDLGQGTTAYLNPACITAIEGVSKDPPRSKVFTRLGQMYEAHQDTDTLAREWHEALALSRGWR